MTKKQGQKTYFKSTFGPIFLKLFNALQVYTIGNRLLISKNGKKMI